ncbi:MAG: gamma-glutamyl-gamma-aminobutyrate hydrolase family protein [Eubacteriaceae bacterium]|nr:gamma-glutamyl-gamma-aminobutyrate hydrolase family protein [Eubacteriaceae bacterium]
MKPIIGIVTEYLGVTHKYPGNDYNFIEESYVDKVHKGGGIPLLIPTRPSLLEDVPELIEKLDGIILSGGVDVHPSYYGEEPMRMLGYVDVVRDEFEIALFKQALERKISVFGICRGMQLMNVALGGTLYQDIPTQIEESIQHNQMTKGHIPNHYVHFDGESFLREIYGEKGFVNSFHHQTIKAIADGLVPTGWSKDRIIEAVEYKGNSNVFGVQWHPELTDDKESFELFKYFIQNIECKECRV